MGRHLLLANVLDRRGVQLVGQVLSGFARSAVVAEHADLDGPWP
jgi:hypothetical protein